MTPDEKIQALKDEITSLEKEMAGTTGQNYFVDCLRRQANAERDIAILEKFQNKDHDLLPAMEALLRAAVKADQAAYETARAKLAESAGELAQLDRFKQLLNG